MKAQINLPQRSLVEREKRIARIRKQEIDANTWLEYVM
jgi:hypothetical protein